MATAEEIAHAEALGLRQSLHVFAKVHGVYSWAGLRCDQDVLPPRVLLHLQATRMHMCCGYLCVLAELPPCVPPAIWSCALQVFVLNRTQEILQQQEDTLQWAVQKLEQKAGVQVRGTRQNCLMKSDSSYIAHLQCTHCCCQGTPSAVGWRTSVCKKCM
jgi:hypothetical protein